MQAMIEEYQSLINNDVWDVVPIPKGNSIVSSKWIFKTKHSTYGTIKKFKERFVAWGFSQKEGIDYKETFAPILSYNSIITILSLEAKMKWNLHEMDVKITFLTGVIK